MRPHPSPLIFKKAVDHTCSRSILGCGNHDGGNGTECAICLGAVTLRFYGNTPPGVTVTLLSFLSLPAILRSSLGPVKKGQQEWSHESESGKEGRLKAPGIITSISSHNVPVLSPNWRLLRLT